MMERVKASVCGSVVGMLGAVAMLSVVAASQTRKATHVEPTGPTVVIDTAMGRITCKLYSAEAPVTSASFLDAAEGKKDWTDPVSGAVQHGVPFYDGTTFVGVTDGVMGGGFRGGFKVKAGPSFAREKNGLGYDRAGRLVMAAPIAAPGEYSAGLTSAAMFFVTEHADEEYKGKGGTVFGQCDEASLPVVVAISHALLSTDNHPAEAIAINHVAVVREGEAMPAVAAAVLLADVTPHPVPMAVSEIPSPEPTGPTAVIETTMGTLTCRLFDKEAPIGVANFIGLENGTKEWKNPATHVEMHGKKFYDGLSFRRVIPDFMIQNADLPGDPSGDGDIGFHFANEIVPGLNFDRPGRLAYANAGPNTNESEFFITEAPNHRLDGNYTIFGQCDDASVKVAAAIARVPRDEHNRPVKAVVIRRITFEGAAK
jgi:cyclophilin family peptidyl-prolyl cis-trans isomerase